MRNVSILFFCICLLNCSSSHQTQQTSNTLLGKDLLPYGRYAIANDQSLELISSAVHFGFSFTGKQCVLYVSLPEWLDHNYLQYELDGVYQKRIRISGKSAQPITLNALTDSKHEVWIYKATEAHTGAIYVHRVEAANVHAIPNSTAPPIEFIGNSITCGAAADTTEVRCGAGVYHDQHNAYYAYGPRVARNLRLNFLMSSVSGIGIYRNWNSDGPAMPQVYEKTDFQESGTRNWDFSLYRPKVVSIALGTNDLSNGDGKKPRLAFDSSRYVNEYIKFIKLVKSKYPDAQILLLNSPMINGPRRTVLHNCIEAVQHSVDNSFPTDKHVQVFYFNPMIAGGCTGHPSVKDHEVLAEELAPFIKKLID